MLYRRMKLRGFAVLASILALVVLPNLIDFLMEWLWFGAIGYRGVYLTSLRAQASMAAPSMGAAISRCATRTGSRVRRRSASATCSSVSLASGRRLP